MTNGIEEFEFSSKAEEMLAIFLGDVWKALTDDRASPDEAREISGELQEHILQAYWKETSSKIVKEESLKEILVAMGDPREIASEYLLDRRDETQIRTEPALNQVSRPNSDTEVLSSSKIGFLRELPGHLDAFIAQRANFVLLTLPLVLVMGLYGLLLLFFSDIKDGWIAVIAISDIILLIPIFWHLEWKRSKELNKLSRLSPQRFRSYVVAAAILLVIGGFLLPFLRVEELLYGYSPPYDSTITLEGRRRYLGVSLYRYEYWIQESYVIATNVVQFILMASFLLIAFRAPVRWKQFGVRVDLISVYLPKQVGVPGLVTIRTTNSNPIGISQVQVKVLDPSSNLETATEPSGRIFLGPRDTATWFIRFVPKTTGMMPFGRIIVQLADNLTIFSRNYYLRIQKWSFSKSPVAAPKLKVVNDFAVAPDFSDNCGICRQPFRTPDLVSFCQLCGSLFHRSHLQEWLKNHQTCPNCTKPIKIAKKEKNYLQMVLGRLKNLENESKHLRTLLERSKELPKEIIDD